MIPPKVVLWNFLCNLYMYIYLTGVSDSCEFISFIWLHSEAPQINNGFTRMKCKDSGNEVAVSCGSSTYLFLFVLGRW